MIYKISLITVALAAVAAFIVSGKFDKAAQEATLLLNKSQQELREAQEKEQNSATQLAQILASNADITEESYKEWEKFTQDKMAARDAAAAQLTALINQYNAEIRELNARTAALVNENITLQQEIRQLQPSTQVPDSIAPELLNKIIAARMNVIHEDKASQEALSEVFEDVVYELGGHITYPLQELSEAFRNDVMQYSPRIVKVKAVAVHPSEPKVEIIMAHLYKAVKTDSGTPKDKSGYLHITYQLGDDGKIVSMSEHVSDTEPLLTEDFIPYQYPEQDVTVAK